MTNPVQVHRGSSATSTVVALHCSLGSGRHWASLAEELAGKYVFIAPDISGYGNDAGPSGLPTTLAEQVVTAAAAAIKVPTLLLSGGLSPYLTQRIVWRLTNAITGVKTHHLPTAGHMLLLSHSAAVIPEIVRHIALADRLEQRSAL